MIKIVIVAALLTVSCAEAPAPKTVTKAEFDQIKVGGIAEQIAPIGDPTDYSSQTGPDGKETTTFTYRNQDGSYAIIMLQDGYVFGKTQNGL